MWKVSYSYVYKYMYLDRIFLEEYTGNQSPDASVEGKVDFSLYILL